MDRNPAVQHLLCSFPPSIPRSHSTPPPYTGNIIDRKSAVQHLLNDPRDPFNRQPMSEADLEPQPELRQRIQDWVAQQRAASRMQQ